MDESFQHATAAGGPISALRLAHTPSGWFLGAQLLVADGTAARTVLRLSSVDGDVARLEPGQDDAVARLAVGDAVVLDNSSFLAAQTYHRHQVPGPEFEVWNQFRDERGEPLYPQRPMLLGPLFTQNAAGTVPTGNLSGKVIVVACLLDREAFPWQADWLRARVAEHLGDAIDERFRLWYIDNALHGDDDPQEFPDRSVEYVGALEAALRQVAAWVERGVEPSPTSVYALADGQISLPASADERRGVQPVVALTADGAEVARVRAGEPVELRIEAEAPGDGVVAEIRLVEDGVVGDRLAIKPGHRVTVTASRTFARPGTQFVAALAVSRRRRLIAARARQERRAGAHRRGVGPEPHQ